jgi:hypothetical protein
MRANGARRRVEMQTGDRCAFAGRARAHHGGPHTLNVKHGRSSDALSRRRSRSRDLRVPNSAEQVWVCRKKVPGRTLHIVEGPEGGPRAPASGRLNRE